MIISADNKIPFLEGYLERFASINYLSVQNFIHENIKDSEVLIIRTPNKCTGELLSNTKVKFIASTTSGYDHIDTDYCKQAGIDWIHSPGSNAKSVAQYIIVSLIELAHKEAFSLKEKRIGIVGVGRVGHEVEKMLKLYGIKCLLCDPPRAIKEKSGAFVDLKVIADECDIISFHVPLIKEGKFPTFHMANDAFFKSLKRKPYFINAARGSVHDTEALIKAKEEGLISGMIIDCWENEPFISQELLDRTSIATPHIAGFSADGKANGTRMCLEAIANKYKFNMENLDDLINPDTPVCPVINADRFSQDVIDHIILETLRLIPEDQKLRKNPEQFEYLRTHYENPREFSAYTVMNVPVENEKVLSDMGFGIYGK